MKFKIGSFKRIVCGLLPAGLVYISSKPMLAATNDLAASLQKGLFEEEANHNYPAAITAYETVVARFDDNRKLAATAIFRIGEIYRKQGKTNEAAAQFQRVLREFQDQSALTTLSRSYLGAAAQPQGASVAESPGALLATEAEEIKRIQAMIKESPDLINAVPLQGWGAPLHKAAYESQLAVAEFLLANGADIEIKNQSGQTPLHLAAQAGRKGMTELLLGKGARPNVSDKEGNTPLHWASRNGFKTVAEALLSHNADVNARDKNDATPLHLAAAYGFKSIAELLLAKGADPNLAGYAFNNANLYGTPLHIAVARADTAMTELLI